MITVYSKTNCVPCKMVKLFLTENDIEFYEKNVDTNPVYANEVREMGYQSVPLLVKDGEVISTGFEPSKLESLL